MPAAPPPQAPAGYYPPPPPGGYPPPPPPPGSLHKSSKSKTIGIIVAGVVGVGVLGGLGAVVFGGGDDKDDVSTSEASGNGSGILNPDPVGSATPQPTEGPTDTPTTEPTVDPTSEPTADPTDEPTAPPVSGDTTTIGSGVQVFVPDGWEIGGQGNDDVGLTNGDGSWAYALTGVDDPSVEASAVLSANLDSMLPPENYSQLNMSDVRPLPAFGSVVSIAVMDYESLWVDAQSSIPLHGQVYVAVRQDGVVLLISVEHTPPGDFTATIDDWGPVVDNTFALLGGA